MDDPRAVRRRATRRLFAVWLVLAPAPFSLLFIAGLVPLPCTATLLVRAMAAPGNPGADWWLLPAALTAHLVVDGVLLYLLAALVCRLVFALLPVRAAALGVVLLVLAQIAGAFFPIYLLAGAHDRQWLDVARVCRQLG